MAKPLYSVKFTSNFRFSKLFSQIDDILGKSNESVIDGLISVNASNYSDTFSVKPRVQDINGPTMLEIEDRSHFVGVISCQFSANA